MNNFNTQRAMMNEKSTLATVLLYFFLGSFGAHRFYTTGVNTFNVIYFFTFGYLSVMIFADLFLVWGMAKKENDRAFAEARNQDILSGVGVTV